MIDGIDSDAPAARQQILTGRRNGEAIDTGAKALSSVLTAFGTEIARLQRTAPVSRVMIFNYIAQHSLGLPRSY